MLDSHFCEEIAVNTHSEFLLVQLGCLFLFRVPPWAAFSPGWAPPKLPQVLLMLQTLPQLCFLPWSCSSLSISLTWGAKTAPRTGGASAVPIPCAGHCSDLTGCTICAPNHVPLAFLATWVEFLFLLLEEKLCWSNLPFVGLQGFDSQSTEKQCWC